MGKGHKNRLRHGFQSEDATQQMLVTYNCWCYMKSRCCNPADTGYRDYGARGITVCERWMTFDYFLEDMGCRPDGMSLGRIDNDGNYCKDNCRWETTTEQARNTRKCRMLTANGRTQCVIAWSEESGVPYRTILARLVRGWDDKRAIFTPPRPIARKGT